MIILRFFKKGGFLLLLPILLLTPSCEKYPGISGENTSQLVCWTDYDTTADFTQYKTFTIVDSIGVITSLGKAQKEKNHRSEVIRKKVISCMEDIGYVYSPDQYDLFVSMTEIEQTNISISYDPYMYFWNSYDPWGWGYYYGYPYYPQYYISSAYSTQTFSIQIGDKKNEYVTEDGIAVLRAVWSSAIKGLTGYDRTDSEIEAAITECFSQTDTPPFN